MSHWKIITTKSAPAAKVYKAKGEAHMDAYRLNKGSVVAFASGFGIQIGTSYLVRAVSIGGDKIE